MTNLIAVEIRRLLSRRLFKVLSLLTLVAFATAGVITFIVSNNSPEAVALGSVPFRFVEMDEILLSIAFPLMMLPWLLGASAIGAEWAQRTIMTTLTWDPRRVRVLIAKAVALASVAFAWVILLEVLFVALMYPAGRFEGSMVGVDAAFWNDLGGLALRIGGIGILAALLGFSLGAIGRNTAAALGVGFVYLAVVEGLIRGLKPAWAGWLIGDNIALVLVGDVEVNHLGHSQEAGALLLATYALGLVLIATMTFYRRDVT